MSILTSISASFATGLSYGGPVVCIWGWIGEWPAYQSIGAAASFMFLGAAQSR